MKKMVKKVLLLFVLLVVIGITSLLISGKLITINRCVIATDGTCMIMDDGPIIVANQAKKEQIFSKLNTGDMVLVVRDSMIETSYPAQTGVYWCMKLLSGNENNIPQKELETLKEMGYIYDETIAAVTEEWEKVEFSYENVVISIRLPEGWEYSIGEFDEEDYGEGIDFWPSGKKGCLSLEYYPRGFGVCGTGLDTKEIEIAGMKAIQGTYDGKTMWDYISFFPEDIDVAIWNSGTEEWWEGYRKETMKILQTIEIQEK